MISLSEGESDYPMLFMGTLVMVHHLRQIRLSYVVIVDLGHSLSFEVNPIILCCYLGFGNNISLKVNLFILCCYWIIIVIAIGHGPLI